MKHSDPSTQSLNEETDSERLTNLLKVKQLAVLELRF